MRRILSMLGKTRLGKTRLATRIGDLVKLSPTITQPFFPSSAAGQRVLIIACNPRFDQSFPSAASHMLNGFARGWAAECGPVKLVSVHDLIREIDLHDNPAVFASVYELAYLSRSQAKRLRKVGLFVWISIHPKKIPEYEHTVLLEPGQTDTKAWRKAYPRIIESEPKFVWNSACKSGMHWYREWIEEGLRWETIHPAVDDALYFHDPAPDKYGHLKMAYVGGYWAEKAQAFDTYLRPWEDILFPFGFSRWPYRNYGGKIGDAEERQIYSSAGLIPLVTSPAGWLLTEITERYLKAPACKAFCISDENPALRDIFSEEEMLQAQSSDHFHDLVRQYLAGKIDTRYWSARAWTAVRERHLYSHRAAQIRAALTS